MKKFLTIALTLAGVGWLLYQLALLIPAGQDFLLSRALQMVMAPSDREPVDGLEVLVCGSSSPLADPERAQACILVIAGDQAYVVDAGAGSTKVLQLTQAPMHKVRGVLLTHFHSDHISALGDINLNTWVAGRGAPLQVYGPQGVDQVVAGFNQAYALDSTYRTAHHGAEFLPPALAAMQARTITPGVVLQQDGLKITAQLMDHAPVAPAVAYRFDYKGRSVVISGDTNATPAMEQLAQGADLLLHDALSTELVEGLRDAAFLAGRERPARIFNDILDYHAHTEDIEPMAKRAGVRMLALYHFVPPPRNDLFKNIFARHVSEEVVLSHDGMRFQMPAGGELIDVLN